MAIDQADVKGFAAWCRVAWSEMNDRQVVALIVESESAPPTTATLAQPIASAVAAVESVQPERQYTLESPHPRSHLARSACWFAYGEETRTDRYNGEDTSLVWKVTMLLGIEPSATLSHRANYRPAPLVGAFAKVLADESAEWGDGFHRVRTAIKLYGKLANIRLARKPNDWASKCPLVELLMSINRESTTGHDAKKLLYRSAYAALKGYLKK
jgi:hypothetical protein